MVINPLIHILFEQKDITFTTTPCDAILFNKILFKFLEHIISKKYTKRITELEIENTTLLTNILNSQ